MLRTAFVALSCVAMLLGCSEDESKSPTKGESSSQPKAAPVAPPVVSATPSKVVESYVAAVNAGRFDDALKYTSTRSVAASGGPEQARTALMAADGMEREIFHRGMYANLTVKGEELKDQVALVHVLVNATDEKGASRKTFRLIREGNLWKIDGENDG